MKNIRCTLCICIVLFLYKAPLQAQVIVQADTASTGFYNRVMPIIKPSYQSLVKQTATALRGRNIHTDSLRKSLSLLSATKNLTSMDIDALMVLVMAQTAKENENDLRQQMTDMNEDNKQKKQLRDSIASRKKSISKTTTGMGHSANQKEMQDQQQIKLRSDTHRHEQTVRTMNNLMQKLKGAEQQIVQNLK